MSYIMTDMIKNLSLSEKILLVEELWDSIANDDEYPELTASQAAELNRRIDSYHANPGQGRTWDEIRNLLRQLLRFDILK